MSKATCVVCGSVITRKGPQGPPSLYCSGRCNDKATSSRRRTAPPAELSDVACAACDGFVPVKPKTGPQALYCSLRCQSQASYARRKTAGTIVRPAASTRLVICAQCESAFDSARSNARFCTERCGRAWGRAHESGQCSAAKCARPVRAKGLCSMHYKTQARAEGRLSNPVWDDKRRDNYQRRRALKKAAETGDPVRRDDIAARDGYRCGLCAKRVDMTKPWPHPLSPSLDHIIPLTRGGAHDPSNVQLAHLRCNTAKGNRGGGEQLMLIG